MLDFGRLKWFCNGTEPFLNDIHGDDIIVLDTETGIAYLGRSYEGDQYIANMEGEVAAWLQ